MNLSRRARSLPRSLAGSEAHVVLAGAWHGARRPPVPARASPHQVRPGQPAAATLVEAQALARLWQGRAFDAMLALGREREHIAAGLHDDIGQTLSVAALKLGELQLQLQGTDGAAPALVTELRQLLGQAARATRSATFELSCPLLGQLGLHAALDSVARRAEAHSRLQVTLRSRESGPDLEEPVLGVVFRIARELVFNVGKHAQAQHAELRLRRDARGLGLTVADDGVGFQPHDRPAGFGPDGGYGLVSAMVQAQALGGRLVLRSRIGRGTVARLWVPARAIMKNGLEPPGS